MGLVLACRAGRFGKNCQEPCQCYNGASCDKVRGTCQCAPGYLGATCQQEYADPNSVASRGDLPDYLIRRRR